MLITTDLDPGLRRDDTVGKDGFEQAPRKGRVSRGSAHSSSIFSALTHPPSGVTQLKLLLAYPFMTAKVVTGMHWEALVL